MVLLFGRGSRNRYQNGTLVCGNMDQHLRNPSCLILSRTHFTILSHTLGRRLAQLPRRSGRRIPAMVPARGLRRELQRAQEHGTPGSQHGGRNLAFHPQVFPSLSLTWHLTGIPTRGNSSSRYPPTVVVLVVRGREGMWGGG